MARSSKTVGEKERKKILVPFSVNNHRLRFRSKPDQRDTIQSKTKLFAKKHRLKHRREKVLFSSSFLKVSHSFAR